MPSLRHRKTSIDLKKSKSVIKNQCMLARSEFFSKSSEKFLQELSTLLEVDLFLPEQEIIKTGDDGDRMYFLNWGSVEVILGEKVVGVLESGQVFGEMALFGNGKRTCTVRALDTCDCRSVNQHSFQRLLLAYPKERERFEKLVEDRMQETSRVKQDLKRERDDRKPVAPAESRLRSITLRSLSVIAKMGVRGLQQKASSLDSPQSIFPTESGRRPKRTRPATDGEVWETSGCRLSTDSSGMAVEACRSAELADHQSTTDEGASIQSLSRRSSATGTAMNSESLDFDSQPQDPHSFHDESRRTSSASLVSAVHASDDRSEQQQEAAVSTLPLSPEPREDVGTGTGGSSSLAPLSADSDHHPPAGASEIAETKPKARASRPLGFGRFRLPLPRRSSLQPSPPSPAASPSPAPSRSPTASPSPTASEEQSASDEAVVPVSLRLPSIGELSNGSRASEADGTDPAVSSFGGEGTPERTDMLLPPIRLLFTGNSTDLRPTFGPVSCEEYEDEDGLDCSDSSSSSASPASGKDLEVHFGDEQQSCCAMYMDAGKFRLGKPTSTCQHGNRSRTGFWWLDKSKAR
ncbi:HCN4 [Symbiodinium microadriaticum]|nr:HCN4 [Symbiodinium microadriaticum]